MANFQGFAMSDLYGNGFGVNPTTREETAPESSEQSALANEATPAPTKKHSSILTWLAIFVIFVVLFQFGGK